MSDDVKLVPCPWVMPTDSLRGEHHVLHFVGGDDYSNHDPQFIECSCGAQGPAEFTEDVALAAWNARRVPALTPKQEAADEMFDALRECMCEIRDRSSIKKKALLVLAKAGRP